MAQAECSSFKQLLKQLYTVHTSKVKELENEIKVLKEKLTEKERESNASLTECKRCIELEEAFKSCKKALLDQSKLFESFGQKFSIFNSPGFENQDSKDVLKSSNDSPEKTNHPQKFKNDMLFLEKNKSDLLSLEGNTITEIKINATDKLPVVSNKNLLKKVMHDEENLESLDLYTVTFPEHLKQGLHSAKFDSLVLAPDSLDTTFLEDKKICTKQSNENHFRDCTNKAENKLEFKLDGDQNLKNSGKVQEDKSSGKRLSSDSLNDDRIKRCNTGKQSESSKNNETNSKLGKSKEIKNLSTSMPKITVTEEASDIFSQMERKNPSVRKDINILDVSVPKNKNLTSITVDSKNETPKNSNLLNVVNKSKLPVSEISPSLLPTNANVRPKITDLEDISNDNDDFQELIPSIKNVQNEDSWDACDKKKSVVKKRVIKSIKTTTKYKMTLDAPSLNYKKPSYKQTKLSKSIFQPKSCASNKKSHNRLSEIENIIPVVTVEEDTFPTAQDRYVTSTPYDPVKSPSVVDIDATFVPENFNLESRQCITTNVKKNAVEKSHLKNGSLFSNISFPEELQSVMSENLIENANDFSENDDYTHFEDAEMKENVDDSFDKLPLPEEPAYKYKNDVVRKKSERRQLNGFDCKECEKYYSELGLSDKEKKERMKKCSRHRGKFTPPATPDHFWELEFPDTQECKARGYMDKTQKVKLNEICNI